jgi:large subunit ribosomal protein L27
MATSFRLIQSWNNSLHSIKKSWMINPISSYSPIMQFSFPNVQHQIRTATKKAGGSSNNGRDSAGRRLGVKVFPASKKFISAGSIIIRQRGTKFYPGENAGIGRDHTIYSRIDGYVQFDPHETKKKRHVVHILPFLESISSSSSSLSSS